MGRVGHVHVVVVLGKLVDIGQIRYFDPRCVAEGGVNVTLHLALRRTVGTVAAPRRRYGAGPSS